MIKYTQKRVITNAFILKIIRAIHLNWNNRSNMWNNGTKYVKFNRKIVNNKVDKYTIVIVWLLKC